MEKSENSVKILDEDFFKSKIYTIRGLQVMLDRDLAELYGVETRALKQAVKRNMDRFPNDFMFQLDNNEINLMVSQNVIPSKQHLGGAKPYAFTEQGVSMLSSILKSKIAVNINIAIFRAFTQMKKFINQNAGLFQRFERIEQKLYLHDENFNKIFKAIEAQNIKPKQGIFFNGQIFDAYIFLADLIKSAKKSIVLIDNYIDETVLTLFSKRKANCKVTIYTQSINKQLKLDLEKYNSQYQKIEIKVFKKSHDRFLIIDNKEIYHFGASLKDLGKKWFAFSKFEKGGFDIVKRLG